MNIPHIAPLVPRIILTAAKLVAHIPEDFSTNATIVMIQKAGGRPNFVGGSHMRSRNWSPSAYVRPDLRDTLEKMTRCSRANPSLLVSPCSLNPRLSNFLLHSKGFLCQREREPDIVEDRLESKRPSFARVAILQPRDHLPLHVFCPASAALT